MITGKIDPARPAHFVKTLSFYYNRDWLNWTPEIYQLTLAEKFGLDFSGEDGSLKAERAEALREILRSDRCLENMVVYENVAHALSETHFTAGVLEPCSPEELCYANWVLDRVVGGLKNSEGEDNWKFSESVRAYGATCLIEAEIHMAPDELGLGAFADNLSALSDASPVAKALMFSIWKKAWEGEGNLRTAKRVMELAKKHIDALRKGGGKGSEGLSADEELAARTVVKLIRCCIALENRRVTLGDLLPA